MMCTRKQLFLGTVFLFIFCTGAIEPEQFSSTLAWPRLDKVYNYVVERTECSCAPPSLGQRWFPALYINCSEWLATAPDRIPVAEGVICNGGMLYPFLRTDLQCERVSGNNGTHVVYDCRVHIHSTPALSLLVLPLTWLLSILCNAANVRLITYRLSRSLLLYRARKLFWLFTLLYFLSHITVIYQYASQLDGCFLPHTPSALLCSTHFCSSVLLAITTLFVYFLTYLSAVLYAARPPLSAKQD